MKFYETSEKLENRRQMARNGIIDQIYVIDRSIARTNSGFERKIVRDENRPSEKTRSKIIFISKDENERGEQSVGLQYPFEREESSIGKGGWSVDHQSRRVRMFSTGISCT